MTPSRSYLTAVNGRRCLVALPLSAASFLATWAAPTSLVARSLQGAVHQVCWPKNG